MDQAMLIDFKEYRLLCKAHQLKNLDKINDMATQAFLTNKATLRDKKGRLICKSQKDLFNYEKALKRIDGRSDDPKDPKLEGYKNYLRKKGG